MTSCSHEYVFLTGCSRSGTSILAEALAQQPGVEFIWEPREAWIGCACDTPLSYRYTEQNIGNGTLGCVLKILDQKAQTDKPIRLIKDPRLALMGPWLRVLFPDAKIVVLIRSGLDTVCSLRPGIKANWGHEKIPLWWLYNADDDLTLEEKCAIHWATVNGIAFSDLKDDAGTFWLYYEQLVQHPQIFMEGLCKWLGWLPAEDVLTYSVEKITNIVPGSYQPKFQMNMWFVDDHEVRIDRWRENLAESQLGLVRPIVGPLMTAFGYWRQRVYESPT